MGKELRRLTAMFFKDFRPIFSNSVLFLNFDHELKTWDNFTLFKLSEHGSRTLIPPTALPIRFHGMDPDNSGPLDFSFPQSIVEVVNDEDNYIFKPSLFRPVFLSCLVSFRSRKASRKDFSSLINSLIPLSRPVKGLIRRRLLHSFRDHLGVKGHR